MTQTIPEHFADLAAGANAGLTRVAVRPSSEGLQLVFPNERSVIWMWRDLRQLPDQADRDAMVLSCISDPVARLYLRDVGVQKQVSEQAIQLSKSPRPMAFSKLALWAGAAVASVVAIIFLLVPMMAAQLAVLLPPEGEKALGDTTFDQIRLALAQTDVAIPICEGDAGNAAVQTMYARLNPGADLPYDVQIHILDHEMVNAFALPGGRIVFFRGLIDSAQNPEEVAAVLAHEIGHVVYRDPTRDALRSAGTLGVLGLLFGDFAGGTITLFLANQLINASYSQKAEARADDYAHDLLEKANISPVALGTFFERLIEEHGDAEGIVAHFMSHPQMADRVAAAHAAVQDGKAYMPVLTPKEWGALQNICGRSGANQPDGVKPRKKDWP